MQPVIQHVARVLVIGLTGAAISTGSALEAVQPAAQAVQYRSPTGVEYRSLPDTDAVRNARAALAANPKDIAKIIELGVAQSGVRQFREAIATFTRGLETSRTTRCFCAGAGIATCPCANSIAHSPI